MKHEIDRIEEILARFRGETEASLQRTESELRDALTDLAEQCRANETTWLDLTAIARQLGKGYSVESLRKGGRSKYPFLRRAGRKLFSTEKLLKEFTKSL
jgi:hypothetical protein